MPDTTVQNHHVLVIIKDGQLVEAASFTSIFDRRDQCVAALKKTCPQAPEADVREILDDYAGADPDSVLRDLSVIYSEHGVDIFLSTQEHPLHQGLGIGFSPILHSVIVNYHEDDHPAVTIAHFTDTAKRAQYLRERLINTGAAAGLTLSVSELVEKLQAHLRSLINDRVTVTLASSDVIV